MNTEHEDSFDIALANMELPTAAKVAKIDRQLNNTLHSVRNPNGAETSKGTSATTSRPTKTANAAASSHCILVNPKQRGNPLLKSIQNVPLEYRDDIIPDYIVGRTTCILYLSLRYHNLNPDYICQRIKDLGKQYELRVLLVQVDTQEPQNALKNLIRICLLTNLTLMLAWNADEAGRMIETYKLLEKRGPDSIMERIDSNPFQNLITALTSIKPINKTDAVTLLQNFGSLKNLINASEERLSQVVGLGPRKAKKLYKTLHEPFLSK